jgi:hypothetical protein
VTGELTKQFAARNRLGPSRELSAVNAANFDNVITKIRDQLDSTNAAATAFLRKLGAAAAFVRASIAASSSYERYIYLWFSLEAVLSNLDSDHDEYERAVPIGTRVAYRASLLARPPKGMNGRTYGLFRWATIMELDALYRVRCAAVHEAGVTPAIDEVLLARFERVVYSVVRSLAQLALSGDLHSAEELLIFADATLPATAVIS